MDLEREGGESKSEKRLDGNRLRDVDLVYHPYCLSIKSLY